MKKKRSYIFKGLLILGLLILVNTLTSSFFFRIDLTEDKRYTLSEPARQVVSEIGEPLIVDVFLEGDFPSEFRKLQMETRQLLEEFNAYNNDIKFNFVNPLKEDANANEVATQFYHLGMTPARINVVENGRSSEAVIFPWAMANYKEKSVIVPLMRNQTGATSQERINNSVQQLEYAFSDAFSKLLHPKHKKIAVMRGNAELPDILLSDFIKSLQEYYLVAPFTLDSVANNPQGTLEQLKEYDMILEAKPTVAFSEAEKFVLDQYLMHGGKAIWMLDRVAMETDSLFNVSGSAFALPRDLNLDDYFFKYGLRINPNLVQDLYSAPLVLASGTGNNTQFNPHPWPYFPLTSSMGNHAINNNIEAVQFEYASTIDTLKNDIKKTILLATSPLSRTQGTPLEISLDQIQQEPNPDLFQAGSQTLAVLLEGRFTSVYENRIKPFELAAPLEKGKESQMLVISDGDIIKNDLQQGRPLELGFDRFTGMTYGNKEFLLNAVNYMLDDQGLVEIRSKQVAIPFMDLRKADEERTYWQIINLVGPLFLLAVIGLVYYFVRSRRYRI